MSVHPPKQSPTLSHLVRASREMSQEADPVKAVSILVSALREELDVDRVGVFIHEHHAHTLDRVFGIDAKGLPESGRECLAISREATPLMDVANRVRPHYLSDDARADYPGHKFAPGVDALGVIPIIVGEELLGVLCVDNCLTGRPFAGDLSAPLFLYAGLAALPLFALYRSREVQRLEALRRHIVSEVLYAVTGGKIRLCEGGEMDDEWPPVEGKRLPIQRDLDVRGVREAIRKMAAAAGMSLDRASDLGLCASEAATNALLHGSGGFAVLGCRDGKLRVRIQDHGGGISTDDLPRATLLKGWSKRASMGLGFTVIKETADLLLLATGSEGTTVIIEMSVEPQSLFPEGCDPLKWGQSLAY